MAYARLLLLYAAIRVHVVGDGSAVGVEMKRARRCDDLTAGLCRVGGLLSANAAFYGLARGERKKSERARVCVCVVCAEGMQKKKKKKFKSVLARRAI